MKQIIELMLIFVVIWIVASILTGMLAMVGVTLYDYGDPSGVGDEPVLIVLLTLGCQFLLMGALCFIAILLMLIGYSRNEFYKLILNASFLIAIAEGFLYHVISGVRDIRPCMISAIVIASGALLTLILFQKTLKSI